MADAPEPDEKKPETARPAEAPEAGSTPVSQHALALGLAALAACSTPPTVSVTVRNTATQAIQGAVTVTRVNQHSKKVQVLEFVIDPGRDTWTQFQAEPGDTMTVSAYPAGIAIADVDSRTPHALTVRSPAWLPETTVTHELVEIDCAALVVPALVAQAATAPRENPDK